MMFSGDVLMGPIEKMLNDIMGTDILKKALELLNSDAAGDGTFLSSVTTVLIPIGISLVTIFWLIEMFNKTIHFRESNLSWEHIAMLLVQLIIAKAIVQNSSSVVDIIGSIGKAVSDSMTTTAIESSAINIEEVLKSIKDLGILDKIGIIFQLFVPTIIIFIMSKVMYIIVYARAIELILLGAFSPIPLSTLMFEQFKDVGRRYLQNYLAVCLQASFLIAILILGAEIMKKILIDVKPEKPEEFWGLFGQLLMYYGVMIFAFVKSGSWSQKIVGLG